MSRRTKSFFEQDHSAKAKAPYSYKRSGNSNPLQQQQQQQQNLTGGGPSTIPPSKETKAKLNAFAFGGLTPRRKGKGGSSDGKEREGEGDGKSDAEGLAMTLDSEPMSDPTKECPQTPAPRLALSDLIGIGEEGKLPQPVAQSDVSPEDRIMWQLSPNGSQVTPRVKGKGQKRKRNIESPPVDAAHQDSLAQRKPGTFSLQGLGTDLKTPSADPAMQLWSKYSTNTNSGSAAARPVNPASRLFKAGEAPQSGAPDLSPLGLRRSYSCGPDWPGHSRLKKRRTNPELGSEASIAEEPTEHPKNLTTGAIGPGPSRLSRVSRLVDKVKETLGKPSALPDLPSSSSPLPERHPNFALTSSPLGGRGLRVRGSPSLGKSIALAEEAVPVESSDSEDFGEFDEADIDMDMLERVEELVRDSPQTQGKPMVEESYNSPVPAREQLVKPVQEDPKLSAGADGEDEFGDGNDDDFFTQNCEELVAKFDTPAIEATPASNLRGNSQKLGQKNLDVNVRDQADENAKFLEEFGEIDFDEWEEEELKITQGLADINAKVIKRYLVLEISESQWELGNNFSQSQKVLKVKDERLDHERTIQLRESWYFDTDISKGDYLHLIGTFDSSGTCVVDNAHNMIVLHPDFLVSSTVVADSFSCVRKAVFQDRVKATGDISKPMVYGNILHSLFQIALEANDFSTVFLRKSIDSLVIQYVESLYMLKEPLSVATEYLRSKIHLIQDWANLFVSKKPKANAIVTEHRTRYNPIVAITKLLDIEEHVWSPMFGLKGMIDATVQATIIDHKSEKVLTIPLELKTGKSTTVMMHRAQTMLYTLLMSDRYDIDVQCGLLYYLENKEMIRVPAIRDELRGMIIGRNRLASYIRNREVLPDMLKSRHTCGNCYAKETCFIYHKLLEEGTPKTSGVEDHFHDMTGHLGKSHQKFFGHWDNLLSKEEKDISRFRKELWGLLSSEREALGRCFGQLVIVPGSISVDSSASKINRYTYSLTKGKEAAVPGFTFLDSMINPGEPIVISDEQGHFALALGYITEIRHNRVTVQVDRRLHNARTRKPGFNKKSNQVFAGIMEVSKDGEEQDFSQPTNPDDGIRYRLDKDEFSNGMASVRNNLVQIMSPKSNEKYRKLLVDLEPPVFKISPTAYSVDSSSQTNLNGDQRKAIEKVMSAQDYALVLGMPGTGKTTTIAHIIRALVGQGKSVLLTSYTHTAVDNILLKIKNDNINTLRLGSGAKIHPEVKSFAQLAEGRKTSFEELRETFHMPKIVATTCLGINHPIFSERKFDYCIVDEASQITLPVCLGPIRMANTFILVGDHYQLPPLVRSPEARDGGLDISLFKLLSDTHPQSVVNLEHQYRMCEEIMTLSNDLIYKGKLKCGNEQVAKRTLQIPHIGGLARLHSSTQDTRCGSGPCWIQDLFADGVKACFVNTDNVPAKEVRKGDRINNPIEADIAFQLVEGFLSCGVDPSSIGVISVYRSQIKILQNLLRNRPSVEMHTADKFQGRDKEIIVISLVRSNGDQNVGELLRDWRRINVAFTRARSKLLILGSRSTLQSNELLADFVRLMERNKWVYDLPLGAQFTHFMPQTQPSTSIGFKKVETIKGPENRINGKKPLSSRHDFLGNRRVLKDIVNGVV